MEPLAFRQAVARLVVPKVHHRLYLTKALARVILSREMVGLHHLLQSRRLVRRAVRRMAQSRSPRVVEFVPVGDFVLPEVVDALPRCRLQECPP